MTERVPITVFTGFLGSGKTTLIQNLLLRCHDRNIAVIVNEFGKVSIDGLTLSAAAAEPRSTHGYDHWHEQDHGHWHEQDHGHWHEQDHGHRHEQDHGHWHEHDHGHSHDHEHDRSHAARVRIVDFTDSLIGYEPDGKFEDAIEQILNDRQGAPDVLIVETSGLAAPTALLNRIKNAPAICDRVYIDSIISVVDTPQFLDEHRLNERGAPVPECEVSRQDVFKHQLQCADIVVLNKIDRLPESEIVRSEKLLRQLVPSTRFVEPAHHAQVEPSLVLGLHLHEPRGVAVNLHAKEMKTSNAPDADALILSNASGVSPLERIDGHSHSGLAAHEHGLMTHEHLHEHDPGWLSFVLESQDFQVGAKVSEAITQVAKSLPLFRAKGFVHESNSNVVEVQSVRERVVCTSCANSEHAKRETRISEIVFIGYYLERAAVIAEMQRCTTTQWS